MDYLDPDRGEVHPAVQDGPQDAAAKDWPHCQRIALEFFPDICSVHLLNLAVECNYDPQVLVDRVFEDEGNGKPYPKEKNTAKRKQPDDEPDFGDDDKRLMGKDALYVDKYKKASKELLKAAFPAVYNADIVNALKTNRNLLHQAFMSLDETVSANRVKLKKSPGKNRVEADDLYRNSACPAEMMAVAEYKAAKSTCQARKEATEAKEREEREEKENLERAKAEGTMKDCECCCEDHPINRMVHCNGTSTHLFCRDCAKRQAAYLIGQQKCELRCLSMDNCDGGFSVEQRNLFLDEGMKKALDLIEQDQALANIPDLARCPFCPYAEEYPPVEENRVFICKNPGCEKSSCRLCQKESHVPQTCEEAAREQGESARHILEEAMSEALIRKCNKCKASFIKENGCNKMRCTKCGNMQCYVCSKSCDYGHFDDPSRGGKEGNCPLFDSVEQRHEDDVKAAQERARRRIVEENPELDPRALEINFSDKVQADDQRRKAANPGPPPRQPPRGANPPPGNQVPANPAPLRQEFHYLGGDEFQRLQQRQAAVEEWMQLQMAQPDMDPIGERERQVVQEAYQAAHRAREAAREAAALMMQHQGPPPPQQQQQQQQRRRFRQPGHHVDAQAAVERNMRQRQYRMLGLLADAQNAEIPLPQPAPQPRLGGHQPAQGFGPPHPFAGFIPPPGFAMPPEFAAPGNAPQFVENPQIPQIPVRPAPGVLPHHQVIDLTGDRPAARRPQRHNRHRNLDNAGQPLPNGF